MELHPIINASRLRFQPGDRSGMLTVVEALGAKHFKRGVAVVYRCLCDCGAEAIRDRQTLIKFNGSCGCLHRVAGTMPKGWHAHPLAKTWRHMIDRCANPRNKSFRNYGARGISVVPRWIVGEGGLTGLECLVADMGPRPAGLTIERVDTNGSYGPGNCIWADRAAQSRNRRVVKVLEFNGQTKTIPEWSVAIGMPYFTLMSRLKKGWSTERALSAPVRPLRRR